MKPTSTFPNDIIALKHFNVIAGAGIKLKNLLFTQNNSRLSDNLIYDTDRERLPSTEVN
jgi:hypothetical protein